MSRKTAIDLFCGAGGLSEGFHQAGYSVLAGNDVDAAAGITYQRTHPDSQFILAPIQDVSPSKLLKVAGLKSGELDILLGGPPCQAYSVYNHQRGMHDERASLFKQYLKMVKGLRPRWFVMENVTGITSIACGTVVDTIKKELGKLGYSVEWQILKAEEFGIPQERRRIFFIGNRVGLPIRFPEPTHGKGLKPFVSIWDAIGDLPEIQNGGTADNEPYITAPQNSYQRYCRGSRKTVLNHSSPKLSPVNLERMQHIPIGGSWRDIPFHLLPNGMKKAKRSDHTKRYGRMRPDGLSCTVLTKCDIHWGAYIHPYTDRAVSVREAARLQGFPDSFKFYGSKTEQYVQVGNAVPPILGRQVAQSILSTEDESNKLIDSSAA
ncbi:DNA cytosine methyltransferase [Magnetovibrio blakemorei]|uniref:Cytosine-specific methyltransferase n=1 Tax=Magnetovibrio blakemorei TaxID=28181 RepID=A0A1E5Q3C6_9PROT|nr:DNA cytosine methyltransferase [Magnetovibrio blakemorei]OEJ64079.1 DNA (cytosine-5-)-methyltransferase [Magnetovibrio blakemorei]